MHRKWQDEPAIIRNCTMTLSALGLFAGAILMLGLSPGPTTIALVARVITHGGWSVLPFTIALWLGEAVWLTAAVLGLSVFLQQLGWTFAIIKWAGFLFLALLACQMWFVRPASDARELPAETSPLRMFCAGLTVTFTNPKIIAFYLALLPTVMDLRQVSLGDWITLTATLVVTLAMIDIFYILLAETARRRAGAVGKSRLVSRCSAVAMGSAAIIVAWR